MTRPGPDQAIPGSSEPPSTGRGPSALIWRWWNLLLLLPLLMLVTPWFNFDKPRLFGLPFFYWYQLLFVFVGVACVSIVYAMTRTDPATTAHPAAKGPRPTGIASDEGPARGATR